jgi:hypothetical protein
LDPGQGEPACLLSLSLPLFFPSLPTALTHHIPV